MNIGHMDAHELIQNTWENNMHGTINKFQLHGGSSRAMRLCLLHWSLQPMVAFWRTEVWSRLNLPQNPMKHYFSELYSLCPKPCLTRSTDAEDQLVNVYTVNHNPIFPTKGNVFAYYVPVILAIMFRLQLMRFNDDFGLRWLVNAVVRIQNAN